MTTSNKKILVFTGGGPAPALNATIAGIIIEARKLGFKVLGGIAGWACIAKEGGRIVDLDSLDIDPERISKIGSTLLATSRTNPFKIESGVERIRKYLKENEIDGVVAIGGDDTLGAASRLFGDFRLPIVGVPKTIDNDLDCTYWTPGFPTATLRLIQFTKAVTQVARATGRIHVIECFGGKAGWLTACAYLGGAKVIVVPEVITPVEKLIDRIRSLNKEDSYVVVAVSHTAKFNPEFHGVLAGKKDTFGHQREYLVCVNLVKCIALAVGDVDIKLEIPSYYLMGADPIEVDRKVAIDLGRQAVKLINNGRFGYMSAVDDSRGVQTIPLAEAVGKYHGLDDEWFDFEGFIPKEKFMKYIRDILASEIGKIDLDYKPFRFFI
ncbi:MAG: 6-phosphofructokinase [Patescibacteria group bacterium]